MNFDKQLMEAKRLVVYSYESTSSTQRRWLEAHLDSYGGESNRISLFVLEGSPAKGLVLVNRSMGIVVAFDHTMRKLKTLYKEV